MLWSVFSGSGIGFVGKSSKGRAIVDGKARGIVFALEIDFGCSEIGENNGRDCGIVGSLIKSE